MAPRSDLRKLTIGKELWDAYADVVGDGGRSADLREYIKWRVDNPTMPLPGRRLGPTKKVRGSGDS